MMKNRIKLVTAVLVMLIMTLLAACGTRGEELVLLTDTGENSGESSLAKTDTTLDYASGVTADITGSESREEEQAFVCVFVCGAVNQPGVVTLKAGDRVADAVEAAGGFREDACDSWVNLATPLLDGEKIYIPTKEETEGYSFTEAGKDLRSDTADDGRVNINTATEEQLRTLPGIGPAKAADIVRDREENGAFESCEDIMRIPGIKEQLYRKISDRITVK